MRQPDTRGRYAKGVLKREAILDAALALFSQVGFQGASLREIARKCGVSHQSLMHYFPTKQELLMQVLHRRDQRLAKHFDDPAGMAVRELVSLAEYNASAPGHIELFSTAAAEATALDHPGHDYYAGFYANIVAATARYLTVLDERGVLRPGITPQVAARILLALVDGLQLQWLYDRDAVDVPAVIRQAMNGLLTVDIDDLDAIGRE
ncbi:MAG: TetR/AcrR family transcriptional regulator [Microbacteriaceae bacterium]